MIDQQSDTVTNGSTAEYDISIIIFFGSPHSFIHSLFHPFLISLDAYLVGACLLVVIPSLPPFIVLPSNTVIPGRVVACGTVV